ncbi:MAG: universal stress protein [Kiritimatiellae bacterium]|nr:universal stress protein [Kiritimatiellia bacterium]
MTDPAEKKTKIEIRKILCPIDFSETSQHALRYAVALAEEFGAELLLMEVRELYIPPPADYPDMPWLTTDIPIAIEEGEDERLENLAAELRRTCQVPLRTYRVTGKAFLEIIRKANEVKADLIVMGTHGRTGLSHILIGSVAERVVRLAPCPVLTVKHPEHKFAPV